MEREREGEGGGRPPAKKNRSLLSQRGSIYVTAIRSHSGARLTWSPAPTSSVIIRREFMSDLIVLSHTHCYQVTPFLPRLRSVPHYLVFWLSVALLPYFQPLCISLPSFHPLRISFTCSATVLYLFIFFSVIPFSRSQFSVRISINFQVLLIIT